MSCETPSWPPRPHRAHGLPGGAALMEGEEAVWTPWGHQGGPGNTQRPNDLPNDLLRLEQGR